MIQLGQNLNLPLSLLLPLGLHQLGPIILLNSNFFPTRLMCTLFNHSIGTMPNRFAHVIHANIRAIASWKFVFKRRRRLHATRIALLSARSLIEEIVGFWHWVCSAAWLASLEQLLLLDEGLPIFTKFLSEWILIAWRDHSSFTSVLSGHSSRITWILNAVAVDLRFGDLRFLMYLRSILTIKSDSCCILSLVRIWVILIQLLLLLLTHGFIQITIEILHCLRVMVLRQTWWIVFIARILPNSSCCAVSIVLWCLLMRLFHILIESRGRFIRIN